MADTPSGPDQAPTRRRRARAAAPDGDGTSRRGGPSLSGQGGERPAPGSRRAARLAASTGGPQSGPVPGFATTPTFRGPSGLGELGAPGPGYGASGAGAPGYGGPVLGASGFGAPGFGAPSSPGTAPELGALGAAPSPFGAPAPAEQGFGSAQDWFSGQPSLPTSPTIVSSAPSPFGAPPAVLDLDALAGSPIPPQSPPGDPGISTGPAPATGTMVFPLIEADGATPVSAPSGAPSAGQPGPPTGRMRKRHTIALPIAFDDDEPDQETMAIRTRRPAGPPSPVPTGAPMGAPPTGVVALGDDLGGAMPVGPGLTPPGRAAGDHTDPVRRGRRSRRGAEDSSPDVAPPPPAPGPPVPDLSVVSSFDGSAPDGHPGPRGGRPTDEGPEGPDDRDALRPERSRAEASASRAGRNLPMAILVGASLGGLVLGSLLYRKEAFIGLVGAAAVLSVWELARAFSAKRIAVPVIPLAVGAVGMLVSAFVAGEDGLLVSFGLTAFGALLWRLIDGLEDAARDVAASVFTAAYVPFLAGFTMLMLAAPDGAMRVIAFILVTIASDIGGYTAGVLFGRHPMAPTVSPKKSWEGFAGSVVGCAAAGVAGVLLLLHGPAWAGLAIGASAVVTATVGDLCESLIKRDLGIKDMGHLLPGHGGMLDRIDSLLLTAPVVYVLLSLLVPIS